MGGATALALPVALLLAVYATRRWRLRKRAELRPLPPAPEAESKKCTPAPAPSSSSSSSTPFDQQHDGQPRNFPPAPPLPWSPPPQQGKRAKDAAVSEIAKALEACGDVHIVSDAEGFELVEVLGHGSFGQAELRRLPRTDGASDGSFVVVKRVPLHTMGVWNVAALVSEITNGAAMRHRFIVRLYGAYLSARSELCMVLQYAAGGTLWDTIEFQRTGRRGFFPAEFVSAWLAQLCSAVHYMHEWRVLHRDISTDNIFLSFYGEILLGDLGLSRQLATENGFTKVGTQARALSLSSLAAAPMS